MTLQNQKTLIVIPAFNEAENLPKVFHELRRNDPGLPYLVVDDGSADQTAFIAGKNHAIVIRHPLNLGYRAAIQTGIIYALQEGYDSVILLDADGQHDPVSIPELLRPLLLNQADLTLGSRFRNPKSYTPSYFRRTAMRFLAFVTRFLTALPITDPTSGFIALNRKAMTKLASPGFRHEYPDANNIIWLHRSGIRVVEVPVLMHSNYRKKSMHHGFKIFSYFFFCFFSIFIILLQKRETDG